MSVGIPSTEKLKAAMPKAQYWAWRIVTLFIVLPVYGTLVADGFRRLISGMGMKLSKIPFLFFLDRFEATYRLHLGHAIAILMCFLVLYFWEQILAAYLGSQVDAHGFDRERFLRVVSTLGCVLIGADLVFFYMATASSSWGGGSVFSVKAAVASVAWVAFQIAVSFVACTLKQDLSRRS